MRPNRTLRGTGAAPLAALAAVALLLLCPAPPAEAANTVHVAATPNNPTANGTALRNAVAGISSNAWGNRFVVKLEPGVYDLSTTPLQMKPWVDIEGEGRTITVVKGTSTASLRDTGIVLGADNAELRSLTVHATGSAGHAVAVFTNFATSLRDVYLTSQGTDECWGLRSVGGDVQVEEVKIYVNCSSYNSGITMRGGGRAALQRIGIRAHGSSAGVDYNVGVWFNGDSLPFFFRDVEIDVGHPSTGPGTGIRIGNNVGGWLEVVDSHVNTSGGIGIFSDQQMSLKVRHSNLVANKIGIQLISGNYLFVHHSLVAGTDHTIWMDYYIARIGNSQLDGGPVTTPGIAKCAGVYDEGFNFFASTCP